VKNSEKLPLFHSLSLFQNEDHLSLSVPFAVAFVVSFSSSRERARRSFLDEEKARVREGMRETLTKIFF